MFEEGATYIMVRAVLAGGPKYEWIHCNETLAAHHPGCGNPSRLYCASPNHMDNWPTGLGSVEQ